MAGPGGPACQVEGCDRDLAALSAYHQKCRVCDLHIKAPSFVRAGLLQRFCQRCGRCHELGAFEGTRRSCRAQLAKHNARWGLRHLCHAQRHAQRCSPCAWQDSLDLLLLALACAEPTTACLDSQREHCTIQGGSHSQ